VLRRLQILVEIDQPEVQRDRSRRQDSRVNQLRTVWLEGIERRLETLAGEAHQEYLGRVSLAEEYLSSGVSVPRSLGIESKNAW